MNVKVDSWKRYETITQQLKLMTQKHLEELRGKVEKKIQRTPKNIPNFPLRMGLEIIKHELLRREERIDGTN